MGIFRTVSEWLTEKSDRFIRGGEDAPPRYYGSREAEQAYTSMNAERPEAERESGETNEATSRQPAASDPFERTHNDYGGRVPYRSKYDRMNEASQPTRGMPQAGMWQQPTAQPQSAPQQLQMQPPLIPNQATMQQRPVNAQPMSGYAQQGYSQPTSNVVPFPGMQRGPEGAVYAHVEYIVLLRNRNECKDVIAYIKSNASVFLNMEFIASDNERQRCVDMLSGAAYTLGCALNKISPRGIYLISSPTVHVVLDPAIQKFTAAPEAQGYARQRYETESYPPSYGAGYQPPVERAQEAQRQQPMAGFSPGSPTSRFQAQGTQRHPPASFGSVMAGNMTGSYPAAGGYASGNGATGRYAAADHPQ